MLLLFGIPIGALAAYLYKRDRDLTRDVRTDPVCGMKVRPDSPYETDFGRRRYHFCTDSCRRKFSSDPQRWLRHRQAESTDE